MENYGMPPDFEPSGIHLFPDYKFYCSGVIIGWYIRARARGKITLSLWRRYDNYSKEATPSNAAAYQRVQGIELQIEEGSNHISFPSHQHMAFTAGFIIGLQYGYNDSKAEIAFDHWKCEVGVRCYSEEIFISNESPNSLVGVTTRLTTFEEEKTRGHNFTLFIISNQTSLFPKIIPIFLRQGTYVFICLAVCLPTSHADVNDCQWNFNLNPYSASWKRIINMMLQLKSLFGQL